MATINATIEKNGKAFQVSFEHGGHQFPVQEAVDLGKVHAADFGGKLTALAINGVAVVFMGDEPGGGLLPTTTIVNLDEVLPEIKAGDIVTTDLWAGVTHVGRVQWIDARRDLVVADWKRGSTREDLAKNTPVFLSGCPRVHAHLLPAAAQAAVRPSTCPGCNGSGVLTDDPQVLRCDGCGGIFTDAETPITLVQALKFVLLNQPMQDRAGADGAFYFDLDLVEYGAKPANATRYHGWADRETKRVVQWG